jgi:thiamine pyrophosphokinase
MATSHTRAVVIAGGELHTEPSVAPTDLVIAADSGYDHALSLGVTVDLLIGDLDSLSPEGLNHAHTHDVQVDRHPEDKDATDLELAIRAAIERGVDAVDVFGGEGGRIDHLLGVGLSISSREWESIDIAWHTGTGIVRTATSTRPVELKTVIGDTITIIPIGDVHGVTTTGLRWPLTDAVLTRGASIGVSNEAISDRASIEVSEGAVLVIGNEMTPE